MKNKKINILLTGGAGYIGSVLAQHLLEKNYNVFVIDNLTTGHVSLVPKKCIFFQGDFSSKRILKEVFKNRIDIIVHMAAYIEVEESIKKKRKYMDNNYKKFKIFLKFTNKYCKNIIFASTASVYKSKNKLIKENSIIDPINPYAESKLQAENSNKLLLGLKFALEKFPDLKVDAMCKFLEFRNGLLINSSDLIDLQNLGLIDDSRKLTSEGAMILEKLSLYQSSFKSKKSIWRSILSSSN